jgi:hypothetical protein
MAATETARQIRSEYFEYCDRSRVSEGNRQVALSGRNGRSAPPNRSGRTA